MYASKGHYSQEISVLKKIDRFGIEAVLGRRQLYYGELRKMIAAENIVNAYESRQRSENWADWASKNTELAAFLAVVEKLVDELDGE